MTNEVMDIKEKRKFGLLVLKWCIENFGINKRRKGKLKLSIRLTFKRDGTRKTYRGAFYFKENKIIVYSKNVETYTDVVKVIIHEYTHYLQSMTQYWVYDKSYSYAKNPFERQATRNEDKYSEMCLNDLGKNLND